MIHKLFSSRIYFLSLIDAVLAAACYVAALYLSSPIEADIYLRYEGGLERIALLAFVLLVVAYLFDSHRQIRVRSRIVVALNVAHLIGITVLVHAALSYINPALIPPQSVVLIGTLLTLIVLIGWRTFVRPAVWNAIGAHTVLFVGWGHAAARLAHAFEEDSNVGMQTAGFVGKADEGPGGVPVRGGFEELRQIAARLKPDRIIVSAENISDKKVLKILFDLRTNGLAVESASDIYEGIFGRVYTPAIEPYTVIFRNELSAPPGQVALQSVYTNLLALVAVIALLPVMVITALLLKLTRGGHVLAKDQCVGLHGVPFNRFRFRYDPVNSDFMSRLLIRFKLAGLPQVLNIVRGEMALIGPRPERIEFSDILDDLIPFHRQKRSVKPGFMGWSQLHCDARADEDSITRLEYDLYYIKHISLVLDAYTVIRTIKWVVSPKAATTN